MSKQGGALSYNSLVGYRQSVLSGLTSSVQRAVMTALFESISGPMTRRQIEVATRIRISSITPAVLCLIKSGQIVVSHTAVDPLSGYRSDYLEPAWPQQLRPERTLPVDLGPRTPRHEQAQRMIYDAAKMMGFDRRD